MSNTAFNGTGTTIGFSNGFLAEIINTIDLPEWIRKVIDASHFGSGTRTEKIPGKLVDIGPLNVTMHYDPTVEPPIDEAEETVTITLTDTQTTVLTFTGFLTNFKPSVPLDDRATATATIACNGDITITPGPTPAP